MRTVSTDEFAGRAVVLTGVGRPGQIGEAVARAFGERGAELVLINRDASVNERAAEFKARGIKAHAYACDLSDPVAVDAVARMVGGILRDGVHALVNMAGGFAMSGPVADANVSVLHEQFAISVATAYCATRAFVPLLRPVQGAVVFFAAAAVLPGGTVRNMSAYAAAKAGVVALMQAVAQEERAHGVRSNAIAPTAVRTTANVASMGDGAVYVEREQVADAVCWLCSDAARAVTGQVLKLG